VLSSGILPSLSVLEREWRSLEAAARPSFFTSWQWIGTLLAAVPKSSRPMLLRARSGNETVAMALLGANDRRRWHGLVRSRSLYLNETGDPHFDSPMIEHNAILAAADYETVVWEAVLSWFSGPGRELHLSSSRLRLPEEAVEARGLTRVEWLAISYSVDLDRLKESDGELYPVLSANSRQQLRRTFRYFEQFGPLHLSAPANVAEVLTFFTSMKALHRASWERRGKPHSFTAEFFEPFHQLLIERNFVEGGIQLLKACAEERVIGYLYNFRLGNRVYAYQSGFDDADRRERPGILAHALAIAHAFQTGAQVYDFMAGRNRLKESFATRCEPMLWQVVQQPRMAFRLEQLGLQIRRTLAHSVGPAAHRLRREIFLCKAHKDTAANVATELAGELRRRESGVLWRSL
jgi:CelD/BcsL family acetyltransferase involved in cellulose biosynthesis